MKVISISPGGMNTPMRAEVAGPEDGAQQQSPEFAAFVIADIVGGKPFTSWPDRPEYDSIPNGADVLVWREKVEVFPKEEMR